MRRTICGAWFTLLLGALTTTSWADDGKVHFESIHAYTDAGGARSAAVADLDGDGMLDIALGSPEQQHPGLRLYLQQDDHTLHAQAVPLPPDAFVGTEPIVAAADVTGDGELELLLSAGQWVYVYSRSPQGWQVDHSVGVGDVYKVVDLITGDWEGDGDTDVFVPVSRTESSTDGPSLLRNDNGVLTRESVPLDPNAAGTVNALEDLDGDGRAELIGSGRLAGSAPGSYYSTDLVIHSHDETGTWTEQRYASSRFVNTLSKLVVGDVTGDGRLDVVATTEGDSPSGPSDAVEVFAGQPDGSFATAQAYPSWENVDAITLGDLDGDSRTDVVVNHQGYDAIGVYEQSANGTLEPEQLLEYFPGSGSHDLRSALQVGDVDGDGRADVVLATDNHGLVVIRQGPVPEPSGDADADSDGVPDVDDPVDDLDNASSAYPFVETLLGRGTTNGCDEEGPVLRYCPGSGVVRQHMAVFLLRSMGVTADRLGPYTGQFADVPASHPQARWIEELAQRGVTAGCGTADGRPLFCPAGEVSRQQMAAFLLRAAGVTEQELPPYEGRFADVPRENPQARWIEELARRGITSGTSQDRYSPGARVSRAQMAVFLVRTFPDA